MNPDFMAVNTDFVGSPQGAPFPRVTKPQNQTAVNHPIGWVPMPGAISAANEAPALVAPSGPVITS